MENLILDTDSYKSRNPGSHEVNGPATVRGHPDFCPWRRFLAIYRLAELLGERKDLLSRPWEESQ